MRIDWRTAFLRQAKSDYLMYRHLLTLNNIPRCQQLHYLQMCTEKLAKGFSTRPGGQPPPADHKAFVNFMQVAARNEEVRRVSHYGASTSQFKSHIRGLKDKAKEVEDLRPRGLYSPNTEYPWDNKGVITSPLDHSFFGLDPKRDRAMKHLLLFLRDCFELPELREL